MSEDLSKLILLCFFELTCIHTLSASVSVCVSPPAANGLSTISHEYLKGSYALDLEAVKQGACALPHLNKTLVSSCKRLNG
jgi:hypothetical protein